MDSEKKDSPDNRHQITLNGHYQKYPASVKRVDEDHTLVQYKKGERIIPLLLSDKRQNLKAEAQALGVSVKRLKKQKRKSRSP